MAKYIKSYSNYVIKGKHQNTKDGVIYERDITTIGGRNQFSKGQVPIYQSGNFVITVNNDNTTYKKRGSSDWYKSEFGDIWTNDVVNMFEKSYETSDDNKIVIKKDFYNLRDYAYYGSCSEMVRASIDDILKTYPGELYIPFEDVWEIKSGDTVVSVQHTEDAAKFMQEQEPSLEIEKVQVGLDAYYTTREEGPTIYEFNHTLPQSNEFDPEKISSGSTVNLVLIDNPFGIDIHSKKIKPGGNPLKFFAEGGTNNYIGYIAENGEWDFSKKYEIDWSVIYDGIGEKDIITPDFYPSVDAVNLCDGGINKPVMIDLTAEENVESSGEYDYYYNLCPGDYLGHAIINFIELKRIFEVLPPSAEFSALSKTMMEEESFDVASKEYSGTSKSQSFTVYIFMGDNNEMKYFVDGNEINRLNSFRIRPKESILDEFFFNLDSFEKILLNRDSDPLYTATLELIGEDENGDYTYTDTFTFPTTYGGYNLGSYGESFDNYIYRLSKVSEYYDGRFSDNLWRSMTHEAIKNFDWTFHKEYDMINSEEALEGGLKIQKILRLYAREFDEVKNYIDAIANNNTVSYDNVSNLPDYFYTDQLEQYGWDVKLIYPYTLKEYINDKTSIPFDFRWNSYINEGTNFKITPDSVDLCNGIPIQDLTLSASEAGEYNECDYVDFEPTNKYKMPNSDVWVDVTRIFTQDYDSKSVRPYYLTDEEAKVNNTYLKLSKDSLDLCGIDNGKISISVSEEGECDIPTYYYHDDIEYSYIDVNNEFMKRLIMNSKDIMRHKGTIESLEMMFSLFNMKKDRDYKIKEYTMFSPYEIDEWNEIFQLNQIEWLNSTKLITYSDTSNPYYGLPVSYRNVELEDGGERRLYPHFQNGVEYDGGTYYQMKGGWLRKRPFMFDSKNNIIPEGYGESERTQRLFTETMRNIRAVSNIHDLLSTPSLAVNEGDIVIVNDLTGRYAIIDGHPYTLYYEDLGTIISNDNKKLEYSYFYAEINNSAMIVGNAVFYDYVIISNPYYETKKQKIDLNDSYYEGRQVKIYVTKETDTDSGKYKYNLTISSDGASINTFTVFENGKYMEGDNFTNYFRINDTRFYDELSVMGWQQLRDDEYDYYSLNTIVDNYEGNNPHNGHMSYDNGHEYFSRFNKLFKYVTDNDLIDYRKVDALSYGDGDNLTLNDMYTFGFSNLVDEDYCIKDYDKYLVEDSKCHYFGDYVKKNYDEFGRFESDTEWRYVLDKDKYENVIDDETKHNVMYYNINDNSNVRPLPDEKESKYGVDDREFDGVTDQILNTKRFELEIYINAECEYSIDYLEQIKYFDSIVMHYITQLIPSTMICTVNYKLKKAS